MTQEQLAQGICSVSYLSKIENGDARSSDEVIEFLCERLGIAFESIDSKKSIEETRELLDDWYKEIRNRDIKAAGEKEPEVKEKIKHTQDPHTLLRYDLFKLSYLLALKKSDDAKELIDRLSIYEDQFTDELRYFYLHFIGFYYQLLEEYNNALPFLEQAEHIADSIGLKKAEFAELYYHKALTYIFLYNNSASINYTHKALAIYEQAYHYMRISDCQTLLGINNGRIHNYEQAEFHYKHALKYAESFNDPERINIILHNLGFLYSKKRDSTKSIEYLKKSFENNSNHDLKLKTLYLITKENYSLQLKEEALEQIKKGIKLTKKLDRSGYYYHYMILQYKITDPSSKKYIEFLRKEAIPYFEKKKQWEYVSEYAELLADLHFGDSKYKKASEFYRLANTSRKRTY
jgi:tetratricopeptide (TPR) repeat protein